MRATEERIEGFFFGEKVDHVVVFEPAPERQQIARHHGGKKLTAYRVAGRTGVHLGFVYQVEQAVSVKQGRYIRRTAYPTEWRVESKLHRLGSITYRTRREAAADLVLRWKYEVLSRREGSR